MKLITAHFKRWLISLMPRRFFMIGALLLIFSGIIFYVVLTGLLRSSSEQTVQQPSSTTSSTIKLVQRRLDGVLVPFGEEAFMPRAIMIDNQIDARPWSGIDQASVVIEAPVEGGITRLLAFFDASSTAQEIGPVRSARPYFVDWAAGFGALYCHIGGSPEALQKINALGKTFGDLNEMSSEKFFWRSSSRGAPHNVYTSADLLLLAQDARGFASSTIRSAWHFQDEATTTRRGDQSTIKIQYGGSYSITWKYNHDRNVYTRFSIRQQFTQDKLPIEVQNVIVIKTDAVILDDVGRLRVRTLGSGDAIAYRDGNRFVLRWRRSSGEPIRFEAQDGTEFLFNRGKTWIQVTTDDRIFGGLSIATSSTRDLPQ